MGAAQGRKSAGPKGIVDKGSYLRGEPNGVWMEYVGHPITGPAARLASAPR
jgi:hypothetical protein